MLVQTSFKQKAPPHVVKDNSQKDGGSLTREKKTMQLSPARSKPNVTLKKTLNNDSNQQWMDTHSQQLKVPLLVNFFRQQSLLTRTTEKLRAAKHRLVRRVFNHLPTNSIKSLSLTYRIHAAAPSLYRHDEAGKKSKDLIRRFMCGLKKKQPTTRSHNFSDWSRRCRRGRRSEFK